MRVLLDHNVPRRLRDHLPGHDVRTTRQERWDRLRNGSLLAAAAADGFDLFLSLDKKLEYEQNLSTLPLPVVVLDAVTNALPSLLPMVPALVALLSNPLPPALFVIEPSGAVVRVARPRATGP